MLKLKYPELIIVLILNLTVVKLVGIFDISKYFSSPGDIRDIKEYFFPFLVFTAGIVPLIEEYCFRSWINEGKWKIVLAIALTFGYLLMGDYHIQFEIIWIIIFIIHVYLINFKVFTDWINSIIHGVLFGTTHLVNFSTEEIFDSFVLLPILIFPQIMLGIILYYIKIKINFISCVLYHVFYNSILITYAYLFD
ncbi:CPBP family glutamic-type intramembrane protease [Echinicola jeungdonensis]|uniref:CPBP family glutamic-type intramembrane protease n=1 Tax=Echinicola jeungdonensis TaxID=709343 RepID=A0ABV5J2Q8_9BACT|nr:CPBP family glutamic-type intramembrane protease [Echinicola jeungdonensis]MDN3667937.1 CPBP family glutamic-type intramembrane protease [Echinicola jeungdonensis]